MCKPVSHIYLNKSVATTRSLNHHMSQLARAKLDNDDTFRLLVSRSLFGVND
jgi:hypothetical protein